MSLLSCDFNHAHVAMPTESLGIANVDYYWYLNQSGTYTVDGTDDKKEFDDTLVREGGREGGREGRGGEGRGRRGEVRGRGKREGRGGKERR